MKKEEVGRERGMVKGGGGRLKGRNMKAKRPTDLQHNVAQSNCQTHVYSRCVHTEVCVG